MRIDTNELRAPHRSTTYNGAAAEYRDRCNEAADEIDILRATNAELLKQRDEARMAARDACSISGSNAYCYDAQKVQQAREIALSWPVEPTGVE